MDHEQYIHKAFQLWKAYIKLNEKNQTEDSIIIPDGFQRAFLEMAAEADLKDIFRIGNLNGFSYSEITNILIMHGAYFRLLKTGVITREDTRFIDSLYQQNLPSLKYYTTNSKITAPWITLPAQELLLDIELPKYTVIEYGSGISTFFFKKEARNCITFEARNVGESDLGMGLNWWELMHKRAKELDINIELKEPNEINVMPEYIINNYWEKDSNLLVFIDGGDRRKHFQDWAEYIADDQQSPILLLVDNSSGLGQKDAFNYLSENGCTLFHNYGHIYGQFTSKDCTSFCTYRTDLLTGPNASPRHHDKRWGYLLFNSGRDNDS